MGPAGLALAFIGGALVFMGHRGVTRALEEVPDEAAENEGRLIWAVPTIVIAVALYFGARAFGYGRVGLYVCVALLMMNAAVAAILRIRWLSATRTDATVFRQYRRGALLQMAGSWILFTGCAVYLLRP